MIPYVTVSIYSGRKLTRFGRDVDWSLLMSAAVTLQDSNDSDLKFFKGVKCCKPSLVILEFDTFRDTKAVNPAGKQKCQKGNRRDQLQAACIVPKSCGVKRSQHIIIGSNCTSLKFWGVLGNSKNFLIQNWFGKPQRWELVIGRTFCTFIINGIRFLYLLLLFSATSAYKQEQQAEGERKWKLYHDVDKRCIYILHLKIIIITDKKEEHKTGKGSKAEDWYRKSVPRFYLSGWHSGIGSTVSMNRDLWYSSCRRRLFPHHISPMIGGFWSLSKPKKYQKRDRIDKNKIQYQQ